MKLDPRDQELRDKLRRNFRYFCIQTLKIRPKREITVGPNAGLPLIPFEFNQAQEHVWTVMQEQIAAGVPIRLVVLKARQFGISTLFCAWIFWLLWRSTYKRAGIASFKGSKETTLVELQQTMQIFYQSFPEGFRPQLLGNKSQDRLNKYDIMWTDRESSMKITPAVADAFRGPAMDYVLCTEVSSYQEPGEFFGGFIPSMSVAPLSTVVLESSPKDGYFEMRYRNAKLGDGGYRAIFLPWWCVPKLYSRVLIALGGNHRRLQDALTGDSVYFSKEERQKQRLLTKLATSPEYRHFGIKEITDEQMYWRQFTIDGEYGGDEEFFNQEFPEDDESCFFRNTRSAFKYSLPLIQKTVDEIDDIFPDMQMGNLESDTYLDPANTQTVVFVPEIKEGWIDQDRRAGLLMFEPPNPDHTYVIGADVADDSGSGLDDDSGDDTHAYSVYCVYCCNCRDQAAEWRGHIPPYDYGDTLVIGGYYYNQAMLNVELNNIGRSTYDRITHLFYPLTFKWPKFDEAGKLTKKEMWVTDAKTKQILIGSLRYAIDKGYFKVRSPGLKNELAGYKLKNGSYVPGNGEYADRIIAAALAWQCVEQTDFAPYRSMVFGGAGKARVLTAAGQAQTAIKSSREPLTVPQELPAEFGGVIMGRVSDIWDGARL